MAKRKKLPRTEQSLVLRTDFSDDATWETICAAIQVPSEEGFRAVVDCVSDPAFAGVTAEQLVSLLPKRATQRFMFVVDHVTLTIPERPLLVVDLHHEPGRTFRVIPREMWGVENNLFMANMDFDEFVNAVEPDGVFRGFPEH